MKTLNRALLLACDCTNYKVSRSFFTGFRILRTPAAAAPKLDIPPSENEPQPISPKIENLVNEIAKLSLIEVSELSSALKKKLNLPDVPAMAFGAFPQGMAQSKEEEEEDNAAAVKSSYAVKLLKFDETKKVPLIKEVKTLLPEMNLVQAKKFVESTPVVIKGDLSKEEADKLKESLEKVGAECAVE